LGGLVAIARATNIGKTNATLNALLNDAASSARNLLGALRRRNRPVAWSNVCDVGASAFAAAFSTNLPESRRRARATATAYCADGQWTGGAERSHTLRRCGRSGRLQLGCVPMGVTTNATGVIDALADQSGNRPATRRAADSSGH
jgi:heme oxygenase